MNPQSELAKKLSIAIQALQSATARNDGPCQHLAAESINAVIGEIDDLAAELLELKHAMASRDVDELTAEKERIESSLKSLKSLAPNTVNLPHVTE
jgi:hypothetical protein